MPAPVLIVEDSPSLAEAYRHFLRESGQSADIANSAEQAAEALQANAYSLLLLDLHLPGQDGLGFLKDLRQRGFATPVIVLTAETAPETARAALAAGAADFISKPVRADRLALTVSHAQERETLKTLVSGFQTVTRESFCDFIGGAPAMQIVYRAIETAAQSRAPVFITGESGTGKELAARALHQLSGRRTGRLEALNCAAIPAALIESEIFGHVKGAFTGATAPLDGAAARAHNGTLFLDELAEMPVDLQSKLLRFTQTGVFRPVGAQRESAVDVRFVSATNRDPLEAVRAGKLREDLYYRLNVIPLHLPPLRDRGGDPLLIAEALLHKITAEEGKDFIRFTSGAERFILSHPWPGNVRQLENALRRAIVLHHGTAVDADMLHHEAAFQKPAAVLTPPGSPPMESGILPLHETERRAIEDAIAQCGGNILKAARALGVAPSTLHRKINRWKKQE
jgi:two-component system repressor protein LuxO